MGGSRGSGLAWARGGALAALMPQPAAARRGRDVPIGVAEAVADEAPIAGLWTAAPGLPSPDGLARALQPSAERLQESQEQGAAMARMVAGLTGRKLVARLGAEALDPISELLIAAHQFEANHDGGLQGGEHLRVGMAADGRSPAADVIDIAVAIHIPGIGAFHPIKQNRLAPHRFKSSHR